MHIIPGTGFDYYGSLGQEKRVPDRKAVALTPQWFWMFWE